MNLDIRKVLFVLKPCLQNPQFEVRHFTNLLKNIFININFKKDLRPPSTSQ